METVLSFAITEKAGLSVGPAFFFVIMGQDGHKLVQTDKGEEG